MLAKVQEAYSKPYKKSQLEHFAKTAIFAKRSILNDLQGS